MAISEFTLIIILLFLPGLIAFLIIDALTSHGKYRLFELVILSFLLGFISYCIFDTINFLISSILFKTSVSLSFFKMLLNQKNELDINEIIIVSIFAIPLGLFVALIINKKILYNLASILKISKQHGSINVFSHLMYKLGNNYVVIRDRNNNRMYQGWIEFYPDSLDKGGIFLRDVIVFNNSSAKFLYKIDGLYLQNIDKLGIEYQKLEKER